MNRQPDWRRITLYIAAACMALLACGGGTSDDGTPENLSPTAVIDTPAIDGLDVSLDASLSTDPEGDTLDCAWDFGDGSNGNGVSVSHTYAAAGSYQVTLTITDAAQNGDQAQRTVLVTDTGNPSPATSECQDWQTRHPEWIFCDDFEDNGPLVADGRYFEHGDNDGDFVVVDGAGTNAGRGIRALWQTDEVGAGGLKLAFGRNPSSYMDSGIRNTEDFTEIYYRMYLKMQDGWQGNPAKLSRATIIAASDWSQAMIAHVWGGSDEVLAIDPVRCVDNNDQPKCSGYNDFDNMDWIGLQDGITPVFSAAHDDQWHCIEAHVKLNDGDQDNGVQEFWIDGQLEARDDTLNFVRGYTEYGINAIFFENYWNSGSPVQQERYFDNIVVSTQPIGCMDPPSNNSCTVLPADNPWNTDISAYPLHPNSDAFIAAIGADTPLHPDFGTVWNGAPNGIPYVYVDDSIVGSQVNFLYDDESDAGPYPIPDNPPIEGGPDGQGDRHIIMVDMDNCKLYELFNAWPPGAGQNPSDDTWYAGSGAIFDLTSNGLRPDYWTSADAAGLPIYPGLVRYEEAVDQGEINHALRFTLKQTQRGFIHPATHFASTNTDANVPPMGLRLRLKADYDISGFPSEVQAILRALKTYGMIVADNGGDMYISGAPNAKWSDDNLREIKRVLASDFEVVYTGDIVR